MELFLHTVLLDVVCKVKFFFRINVRLHVMDLNVLDENAKKVILRSGSDNSSFQWAGVNVSDST